MSGSAAATTGSLTKIGAGTLTLSGLNAYTGGTIVNSGTLNLPAAAVPDRVAHIIGALTINSGATVNADTSWSLGNSAGTSVSSIAINGGTLNFTGNAGWGGTVARTITMTGGTISGNAFDWWIGLTTTPSLIINASSTAAVISSGFLMRSGMTSVTVNVAKGTAATDLIISGPITNSTTANLTKVGAGTLTLSGANNYTGVTTINAGVLSVATIGNGGATGNLGAATNAAANLVLGGGTLQYTGTSASTDRAFTLSAGTTSTIDTVSSLTISGAAAATTGSLTKIGAGTLTLSGANNYTGVTTINAGVLSVATIGNGGATGNLGAATNAAGNLVLGGGTLQYTGASASTDRAFTLTANTASNLEITANTLTMSGSAAATTGSLTKLGVGTLTLSGVNAYTGGTIVNSGTLNLPAATAEAHITGALTINSGATVNADSSWSLGFQNGQFVSSIAINGGTLNFTGQAGQGGTVASTITMTGGTISGNPFDWYNSLTSTPSIIINASSTAAVISSGFLMRSGMTSVTVNVAKGTAATDLIISGPITNTTKANLTKIGAGTLTLSGANTYKGVTTINAGVLSVATIGDGGAIGNLGAATNAAANLVLGGGTLQYTGTSASTNRAFTMSAGTASAIAVTTNTTTLTVSGAIPATTGTLTVFGPGTLTLSGSTTPPRLQTSPSSTTAVNGTTATFTAAAIGTPTPTVKWQVSTDGTSWTDISGATSATYSFTTAFADTGKQGCNPVLHN